MKLQTHGRLLTRHTRWNQMKLSDGVAISPHRHCLGQIPLHPLTSASIEWPILVTVMGLAARISSTLRSTRF
ncbi:MAG: hypothetical protein KGO94_09470 [Alphaproteobacteria bacterium]|nr:hypothetical protein [Alphaproteobacteria bacterium]